MSFCSKFLRIIFNLYAYFLLAFSSYMHAQIFNNTLSLEEFGAIPNQIPTLQPSATLGINPFRILRTNDFQPLELKYQTYSQNRQMLRMGALLNSQSPVFYANNPPGPGLTFPDVVIVSDAANPPNPATNITIDTNKNRLVFSALEFGTVSAPETVNLIANPGVSATAQTHILTYTTASSPTSSLIDYNVIGNVFHDMHYTNFTPYLSSPLGFLFEVTVFSSTLAGGKQTFSPWMPPSGQPVTMTLPAGNKLRLKFYNHQTQTLQTWVIYFQEPEGNDATTPPAFQALFGQAPATLTAQSAFSGFIRAAIVKTDPVPYFPIPGSPTEVRTWGPALGIQTIAPSPAAIFMLWPVEFVAKATQKIENHFQTNTLLPYCPWLSVFLPILGRHDIYSARQYFKQLISKSLMQPTTPSFDDGTNPFLTYLYMNFSHTYANDVACYQSNERPFPNYRITATQESAELVYDQYRDIIPTQAEIAVNLNQYLWTYNTIGSTTKGPLILFPRYKTVDVAQNPPIQGFLIDDPIKGPLYVAEATHHQIVFKENPLPNFLTTQFFPSDFWRRLSAFDIIIAKRYIDLYFNNPANLAEIQALTAAPDGYDNGKRLYKAASTIRYATALMAYLDVPKAQIINVTQPFVNAIKLVIENWLINKQTLARANAGPDFPNETTPNFFIGDRTIGGICFPVQAMAGLMTYDQYYGNAIYNDHHFQYGYWLGASAAMINWDNQYGVSLPWIAQAFTSGSGAGPFKMKAFIDVLWRDTVNPDPNDASFPYHRHGNPWEGHSTANGLPPIFFAAGRNQESLAEDFNCWLGTLAYAQSILETSLAFPGALNAADIQGFDTLVNFSSTFLSMTATAGNLYYNTSHWPYTNTGFNFNVVAAQQYDGLVDSATFFGPGEPACDVCN